MVGRCDAGRLCTPERDPCACTAVHSLPQLPYGMCDLLKSSTRGSRLSMGDLACLTHDPPNRLPKLGLSQGIGFLRTCLQLMSFHPHFV